MARRKPKRIHPVKDLAAANATMAEIGGIKRRIAEFEAQMNDEIDRIKSGSEVEVAPLQARLKELETGLIAYAEHNKEALFGEKRSVEIDFGTIGYRRSKEIKPKPRWTFTMVLQRLKELGFTMAIRNTEKVNKDELHGWPDDRLDLVGARRVEKDNFWYELNEQKLKDMAA
jgi:phage host-nuclease inhibitor protein Gam